jgi:flagellar hook-basal body complex protein FliE
MSCGIGGDLFAIVWDAKLRKLYGLNASGRSPLGISRELIRERGHDRIPIKGPLSWSVPGCVSGWQALHDRFGKQPLAKSLAPAIRYARDGFPVTQIIAGYWRGSEARLHHRRVIENVLGKFVHEVNDKHVQMGNSLRAMLSGENVPLHQVMTEFQEAGVAFTMMVELRNKLLESYKELMSMGL